MKKKILSGVVLVSVLFLFAVTNHTYADLVNPPLALQVGESFIFNKANCSSLYPTESFVSKMTSIEDEDGETLAYVFQLEPNGFVVTSADTFIQPIIAYSNTGEFPFDEDHPLMILLKGDMALRQEAMPLMSEDFRRKNQIEWEKYSSQQYDSGCTGNDKWGPYIYSDWDQDKPYNVYVPLDTKRDKKTKRKERCKVGCVATAMAQIINYHKYPKKVIFDRKDNYTTWTRRIKIRNETKYADKYGYLSFKELNSILKNIPYDKPKLLRPTLSFACGISVDMDYTSIVSGATAEKAKRALEWKFGYKNAQFVNPKSSKFYSTLKENMLNQKPALLFLQGKGKKSGQVDSVKGKKIGHTVAVSGYETPEVKYFLNFGWDQGLGDSWYALPPKDLPGGYNIIKYGILNITPEKNPPNIPRLISPRDGAKRLTLTPLLKASAFKDPNKKDTHFASQWQILDGKDFSNPVWTFYDKDKKKRTEKVPKGKLSGSTKYAWRVRYQDNHGAWSSWSAKRCFTTKKKKQKGKSLVITFKPNPAPASRRVGNDWYWDITYSVYNPNDYNVKVVAFGAFNECLEDRTKCSLDPSDFYNWFTGCDPISNSIKAKSTVCDKTWWLKNYARNKNVTGKYAIWYKDNKGKIKVAISEPLKLLKP